MKTVVSSRLKIIATQEDMVRSIFKALHPDNLFVPENMVIREKIECFNEEYTYTIEIIVENIKKFDSLRGSLDEILTLLAVIDTIMTGE